MDLRRGRALAAVFAALVWVWVGVPRRGAAQVAFQHMRGDGRDIRMTVIADGIYQFMTMRDSYVRQLNTIVVVNDSDVLVFDTGTRPSSARMILDSIRRITPKPVRYIVNSHGHPDHWSGNAVYADAYPGAEIIATMETRAFMQKMADVWAPRFAGELENRRRALAEEEKTGKDADGVARSTEDIRQDRSDLADYATFVAEQAALRRVFATVAFADSLVFYHGGREFRFYSVQGDAEGTTVLWLPRERVLITGDAVSYPIPYVGVKPSVEVAGLRKLLALEPAVIVPGHGPAFHDASFAAMELELLESVMSAVAKGRAAGVESVDEMQRLVTGADMRERFAHGDADLEARYTGRVRDLVALVMNEGTLAH